jgi:hypothetical protein
MSIALAATLHDATGALRGEIRRRLPALCRLYPAGLAVATSPPTAASVRACLEDGRAHAGTPRANVRGPLYRLALQQALATGAERVHYLDFDRALHWQAALPGEYAAVLRTAARHDAVLIGRTERTHRSHHRPLYATEAIVNRLLADRLGWPGRVDFLVPSFVLHRRALETLLGKSRARDATIYGELAALLAATRRLAYVECRGLEWETPDRHRRAVARAGLPAWRDRFDTAEEWKLRTDLAAAFVRGFESTTARVRPVRRGPERLRTPVGRASPRPSPHRPGSGPRRGPRRTPS